MSEDIGQFEIPVEDFVFVEVVETVDALAEDLNGFLLCEEPSFLDIGVEITFVAKLENEIVVIAGFLHIVQFDDVVALTAFEDFDLALEELFEFAWVRRGVPLTFSLRMDLTAMSLLVALS